MNSRAPELLSLNTTFESPFMHALAREAAARCGVRHSYDAVSAIILSLTAFEAFSNEVAQLAITTIGAKAKIARPDEDEREPDPAEKSVRDLALALRVASEQRASVEYRFDLMWRIVTGQEPDRGSGSRQGLSLLIKLRNDLVHSKSQETEITLDPESGRDPSFEGIWLGGIVEKYSHPRYLRSLESKGLLAEGDETIQWTYRIHSPPLAHWACEVVENLTEDWVMRLPEASRFRRRLLEQSLAGSKARRAQLAS